MNPRDHDRMMEILADAVELPTVQRPAFLDRACADDPPLRRVARPQSRQRDSTRMCETSSRRLSGS